MTLTPVLQTTELTIYGSPDTISIVTDIGAKGSRGSLIFSNIGHPDTYTDSINDVYRILTETLQGRDMYYRVDTDTWYQWSNNSWNLKSGVQRLFKVKKTNVTFTAGEVSVSIPISSLWNDTSFTIDNVLTLVQPISSTPTFVTIKSKEISGTNLIINLAGFTFDINTATVSTLTSSINLEFIISLI